MLQTVSATKARENFAELINRVMYGGEEFLIEKQGKPAAILTKVNNIKKKPKKKISGIDFLLKLTTYRAKGPKNLAKNHDKYIWENYRNS